MDYEGLPLAIEYGKKYKVLGLDINELRIDELRAGMDRTDEADLLELLLARFSKCFRMNRPVIFVHH